MVIFEKVQSIHQTESPQKRCMNGAKQMIGSKAMARHYFSVINTKWLKFVHLYRLDGMPAIERRKKGAVGFLTRASHKTGSASITQQCFIILGREGPSLIFVFYTGSWQIRYSAFEKYKTAGWDKIHTKRTAAVPGWRRMLLWIRSQISDWTFRFKMWEPTSTKNWHTHIDLPFYPSNSQLTNLFCISRLDEHCNKYFCFQHKQESTKKRTGRPRCQSNSMQAS